MSNVSFDPGDRADPGDDAAPGAVQRDSGNGRGGGGPGVCGRSRLPAANSGAARSARRASAVRWSDAGVRLVPGVNEDERPSTVRGARAGA